LAVAGLDTSRALGWAKLAEALHALNEMRRHPSKARRGDEASLELCDRPLYVNDKNVLRDKDDQGLGDDGEFLSFSTDAPLTIQRADEARKVLSDLRRRVLAAHRGGGLTCEQLRRDSRRNTYKTGSYFTDDGDLEELDRDLVEQAKQRLQNGEMLQRPLDLFDKAPVQKIEYSKETALVVAEDEDQRATKKRRGGALLRLVESARPPPPLFGPPPPRTADEQRCAAAVDCARLRGNQPVRRVHDNSSLSHFPATTRPSWLGRAVRNRHRHAIEQASRRWRAGRCDDSARTRRNILISTQVPVWSWRPPVRPRTTPF
jgi:hypothetical protein